MDPVTAVGLAASAVQLVNATTTAIKYLNDVKNAPRDRATLAREGSSLLALLTDLRYRVEEADSTSAWFVGVRSLGIENGPLDQFKDAMENLARKLKPETGINKFGKTLIWTLDKNEISNILSKIQRLNTLVSLALQKDHFAVSQVMKHDIAEIKDDMRKGQKNKETQNIINWISPLNFSAKQNDFFGRRQEGTGEWLLKNKTFRSWLDGTKRTLWCPGLRMELLLSSYFIITIY
ncbi:hypothetical protein BGZ60DRAFT_167023 [Tricladium varicosporioides]|nr:hypothetical protein BGZ60DRAFT_167023 [Hymenoscyphus varicosporioides]